MSLYAEYLQEREGIETLEREFGFATFIRRRHDVYIIDIYVQPKQRNSGLASQMADEIAAIAKQAGFNTLTGSVDSRARSSDASREVLRAYGMTPFLSDGPITYYRKEI